MLRRTTVFMSAGAFVALAGMAAALPSHPFQAVKGGSMMGSHAALKASDKKFMTTVAQGSMAEVKLGELAMKKASSADVKNVAQTIVADHTKANASLMQVAHKDHYTLPKDTDAQHKAMYAKLQKLSSAAFDKAYIAGQVKDHDKTVALFQKQMQVTQEPNLKSFETDYLPKIQQHTQMLHQIHSGGSTGKGSMKSGTSM